MASIVMQGDRSNSTIYSSLQDSFPGPIKLPHSCVSVDLVRHGVTYIILYSTFATLLFVLLCAVLFKNGLSPQKRKLPVVWVLGVAMLGGLLGSIINTVFWAYQLFGSSDPANMFRLWISSTAMLYIVPVITLLSIQMRIMSFYPSSLASRTKRINIIILPSLLKIARSITILITLYHAANTYHQDGFGIQMSESSNDFANLLTLIFQFVDNLYASCFLLGKFWRMGQREQGLTEKKSHWLLRWTKQIMYASAFGFAFPTLFSFALVICRAISLNITQLGFMLIANVYVQAFGAVFANLSRSHRWRQDRFASAAQSDVKRMSERHLSFHDPEAVDFVATTSLGTLSKRSKSAFASFPNRADEAHRSFSPINRTASEAQLGPTSPTESETPRNLDALSNTVSLADISPRTVPNTASIAKPENVEPKPHHTISPPDGQAEEAASFNGGSTSNLKPNSFDTLPHYAFQSYETRRLSDATLFPSHLEHRMNYPMLTNAQAIGYKSSTSSSSASSSRIASRPGSGGAATDTTQVAVDLDAPVALIDTVEEEQETIRSQRSLDLQTASKPTDESFESPLR